MTALTTTPSEQELYATLARLHGHRCPMSVLGARLGLAAREALAAPERRLAARYAHQTCALDGIQMTTQCTLGNGNLRVDPAGEHRLLLWAQGDTWGVEATLTHGALERGRQYAELRRQVERLAAEDEAREAIQGEMEAVLRELREAPADELVSIRDRVPVEG